MAKHASRDRVTVRRMFGSIAGRYDLLNHLLSANLDRGWRRAAAGQLPDEPLERVLDLCGGTGDLSLAVNRRRSVGTVVCCDFSREMLAVAAGKFERRRVRDHCLLLEGDGTRLPFSGNTFDAVTVGFGVRNLADLGAGLREMHRVLRPGGRLVVLEFSRPGGPILSRLYRLYLRRLLPRIGDGLSRQAGPYGYLARTISDFPDPPSLAGRLREAGFAACGWTTRSGGIVAIHTAFK